MNMRILIGLTIAAYMLSACNTWSSTFDNQKCPSWVAHGQICKLYAESDQAQSGYRIDFGDFQLARASITGSVSVSTITNLTITDMAGKEVDPTTDILSGDYLLIKVDKTKIASVKFQSSNEKTALVSMIFVAITK